MKRKHDENEVAETPVKKVPPVEDGTASGAKTRATAKAAGKQSPAGKKAEKEDEKALQKQVRKETDAGYAKCKVLKVRFDTTNSLCGSIVDVVDNKQEWSWATSELPGLKAAKRQMEIVTGASDFWSLWSMTGNFDVEAKKKFDTTVARQQLLGMDKIEAGVVAFEKTVSRVQRMHAAATI